MENKKEGLLKVSFDEFAKEDKDNDFILESKKEQKIEHKTLEYTFKEERQSWTKKIQEMSIMIKQIGSMQELLTTVYTERQAAVEYYHYLISLMNRVNVIYRKIYAQKYEHYSFVSQKRFPNENVKNNQILSEMEEVVQKKDALANHAKFMEGTQKTMDNLIFGIKYRIEIEQINRGK